MKIKFEVIYMHNPILYHLYSPYYNDNISNLLLYMKLFFHLMLIFFLKINEETLYMLHFDFAIIQFDSLLLDLNYKFLNLLCLILL